MYICTLTAELTARLLDENEKRVEHTFTNNNDGSYTLLFTPLRPGRYTLDVDYDGQAIPQSPATIVAQAHIPIESVHVKDVLTSAFIDATYSFTVDATELTVSGGEDKVRKCFWRIFLKGALLLQVDAFYSTSSEPRKRSCKVTDNHDGTWLIEIVPMSLGEIDFT